MLLSGCYYHAFSFFFWIKPHHVGRTPIRYFLKTCLQFCVDGTYTLSRSSKRWVTSEHNHETQHQLTKYTTGDHVCKCLREEALAQSLVESLHGQRPQKNSVQCFLSLRYDSKNEWHCRLVHKFYFFLAESDGQRVQRLFRSRKTTPVKCNSLKEDRSLSTKSVSADWHE